MHVLAVPLFRDATGVAVALTAWARHRACSYIFLFSKLNRIFEGLNTLEKSGNFAHAPEVAKIYV